VLAFPLDIAILYFDSSSANEGESNLEGLKASQDNTGSKVEPNERLLLYWGQFGCGTRILRVIHGQDALATFETDSLPQLLVQLNAEPVLLCETLRLALRSLRFSGLNRKGRKGFR